MNFAAYPPQLRGNANIAVLVPSRPFLRRKAAARGRDSMILASQPGFEALWNQGMPQDSRLQKES